MKEDELEPDELDIFDLILKLRQEKLFILDEKNHIKKLNELVHNKIKDVTKSAWITTKQRLLLCQREVALELNYLKIETLNNSAYLKAKDAIGYQASMKIGNILQVLRSQPQQLANWLSLVDNNTHESNILHCILSGLYSYCTFPDDTKYMLVLLHELAKLEFLKCDNPRRLIKQRACAFKTMYFLFNDVQQSAKFFLNATFQMPILHLMSLPEIYLDLDPEKTKMRYKQGDSLAAHKTEMEYRTAVVAQLAKIVNSFITSMLENVYSFPKSIAWIVFHASKIIEKAFDAKEANAVVTELIFTLYICPIILDPEQFGLYNSQVTDIARHNLIQVGQILQCLALSTYEPVDMKYIDLFRLLDKSRFNDFFEMLFYEIDDEPPVDVSPQMNRSIFLFTEHELNALISFLQKVQTELGDGDHFNKSLFGSFEELNFVNSRDNSPKTSRPNSNETIETPLKKSTFFNIGLKNSKPTSDETKPAQNVILIFPIDNQQSEPIGLLSEEKVLNMSIQKAEELFPETAKIAVNLQDAVNQNGHIKQSYTNYPDEGSIGNTSDNLEAISEAASNHSVDSSIELENEDQNDNLSDMVSANVSGRGTPNISGRDTPSSQVIENDDRPLEVRQVDVVQPQPQISRQIRSEIDDKFCKFEIKKLLAGDETISIISDTWSTDVLASDNETIDTSENRMEQRPSLVEQAIHEVHDERNEPPIGNILDLSETQSESAWSTDVMASDTDRLTEVDNDDVGSVAQSDEVRSEIDDNVPSSTTLRRLSSVSQCNGKVEQQTDNNANNVLYKSVILTSDTQQVSQTYTEHTFKSTTLLKSSSSSVTMVSNHIKDDLSNIPGPSGLNKRMNSLETEPDCSIYAKHNNINNNSKKDERPNEILLSNCSLNSSSSGSSSNSFENNKNSHNENSEKWENKQWLNSSGSSLNVTLTPSESTSELSILSGNNPANLLMNKKSGTLMCSNNARNLKPSASTGAIPKSISFDMTADKGLLDDEQRHKRGSFFGKLKMGFRNRRGKSFRNHIDDFVVDNDEYGKKSGPESPVKVNNLGCGIMVSEVFESPEVSEDILAKYRTKPFAESSPIKENCDVTKSPKERICRDSTNNSEINSFNDIKNKLRLVLSNTSEIPHYIKIRRMSVKNKIETVLLIELGKARKLKDWSNVARISEAIRCINLLNSTSCLKLLQSLKEDILLRTTYIQYLNCSTQELLFCKMYLTSLSEQIMHEKEQYEQYLATICVREILSSKDELLNRLYEEYRDYNLIDEKIDYLLFFYDKMFTIINKSDLGQNVLREREKEVQVILERMLMNNVYENSLYPNGDGDRDRDSILHSHIGSLSKVITPHHKDLNISKTYLRECPWIPAQDALRGLNAYRTPRDKINCVVHCAKCIMDLLSMSQNNGTTTADDFTPVLVYVIIKVNPEALLSNIQFVNSFTIDDPPRGEDQYWWTQFCSAVEFIKTMDYSD